MYLTAVFEKVSNGYVAFVEEFPGTTTQGDTLEEARANLVEIVSSVIEINRVLAEESVRGKEIIKEKLPWPM